MSPRVRYFRDRPKRDAVRIVAYFNNLHVFLFRWGVTVRWRRTHGFWRHFTAYLRTRKPGDGTGGLVTVGTWLTSNGVTDRVPKSKRYVLLKVLLG